MAVTAIIFPVSFAGIVLKLEKVGPTIHFRPCHPLQKTTGNSFNGKIKS